jgi:hypothetical protein
MNDILQYHINYILSTFIYSLIIRFLQLNIFSFKRLTDIKHRAILSY